MAKPRVGVIRGGPSAEYEVSLKTGASVLKNLPSAWQPVDIVITKSGQWLTGGLPTDPARLARQVDVIFNALHGEYGEDGQVQRLLDHLMIPYTGSGALASSLGMNKLLTKQVLTNLPIKTPFGFKLDWPIEPASAAGTIFRRLSPPWVIKPVDRGSSVGVVIARQLSQLAQSIAEAAQISDQVLVEEYIAGREATVGVVEQFRQNPYYALPTIEIRPPAGKNFFDYEAKYTGITEEICPGCFADSHKAAMQAAAVTVHQHLGLRHYSRSDFIVSRRGIYFLEVNTLPGLTTESLLPKALESIGCSYDQFLDHILTLALNSTSYRFRTKAIS